MTTPAADLDDAAPPESKWRRRLLGPIRAQLTQGTTPDRIAVSLGVGTACSVFPLFGFTTLLNTTAGFALRLNQPILQTLNQVLGPLQLLLILPYVRLGEWLWRSEAQPITVKEMLRTFHEGSWTDFLHRFGSAGMHAVTAWLITTPLLVGVLFVTTRPILRRFVRRRAS